MRKRYWALFDYDGTLGGFVLPGGGVGNANAAYLQVIEWFLDEMELLGYDREEARETQEEVDQGLCRKHGFSDPSRFPKSFSLTLEELSRPQEKYYPAGVYRRMEEIGWRVFTDFPYAPLEGAIDTLRTIGSEFNIAIVTKGNNEIQNKKIQDSQVEEFADRIFVLGHKSDEEWKWVYHDLGIDEGVALGSWAIGDSAKSDVNPPVRLGTNAIHLDGTANWSFEHAELEKPRNGTRVYTVPTIAEVTQIVGF